ncbi:MAG TPA: transporter [Thermoanaerobaculia bacterium]|nr:transporter [Thermoanaerobaculia bacterium]
MNRYVIAAIATLLLAGPAGAFDLSGLPEPLVTDRPDFTESPSVVPSGHFQVEGGATFTRVEEEDADTFGEILVRIGLGKGLEARIGVPSYERLDAQAGTISGYGDPSLGFKLRLTPDPPSEKTPGRPEAALILSTSIPEGDEELSDGAWQPEARVALSWGLGARFSLSSNVGYAYPEDPGSGDRFDQFLASLSLGIALTDRLGAFVEGYGFSGETVDGSETTYMDAGLTWLVANDLQLDVRAGRGFNDADPDWFVGAGAALRW